MDFHTENRVVTMYTNKNSVDHILKVLTDEGYDIGFYDITDTLFINGFDKALFLQPLPVSEEEKKVVDLSITRDTPTYKVSLSDDMLAPLFKVDDYYKPTLFNVVISYIVMSLIFTFCVVGVTTVLIHAVTKLFN